MACSLDGRKVLLEEEQVRPMVLPVPRAPVAERNTPLTQSVFSSCNDLASSKIDLSKINWTQLDPNNLPTYNSLVSRALRSPPGQLPYEASHYFLGGIDHLLSQKQFTECTDLLEKFPPHSLFTEPLKLAQCAAGIVRTCAEISAIPAMDAGSLEIDVDTLIAGGCHYFVGPEQLIALGRLASLSNPDSIVMNLFHCGCFLADKKSRKALSDKFYRCERIKRSLVDVEKFELSSALSEVNKNLSSSAHIGELLPKLSEGSRRVLASMGEFSPESTPLMQRAHALATLYRQYNRLCFAKATKTQALVDLEVDHTNKKVFERALDELKIYDQETYIFMQ